MIYHRNSIYATQEGSRVRVDLPSQIGRDDRCRAKYYQDIHWEKIEHSGRTGDHKANIIYVPE